MTTPNLPALAPNRLPVPADDLPVILVVIDEVWHYNNPAVPGPDTDADADTRKPGGELERLLAAARAPMVCECQPWPVLAASSGTFCLTCGGMSAFRARRPDETMFWVDRYRGRGGADRDKPYRWL